MTQDCSGDADFCWHDNLIYALRLQASEPDLGNWRSNLILDIDHIVEWRCDAADGGRFRVAPATLTFHDVTDLRVLVDFGDSGFSQGINLMSIAAIRKQPVTTRNAAGVFEYYQWRIELNLPAGGEIVFGASGYTQTLRAAPKSVDEPWLPAGARDDAPLP